MQYSAFTELDDGEHINLESSERHCHVAYVNRVKFNKP
jgi:hypothetical protein